MTPKWRKLVLRGGLGVLLLAVLWWALPGGGSPAGTGSTVRTSPVTAPVASAGEVPVVEMARLEAPHSEPADSGRDPFRFGAASRRPDVGGEGAASSAPGRGGVSPRPVPPAVEQTGPPMPAPPPPIPLKFIGLVRNQGDAVMIAVLSDSRGVYHGREGDIIEGRYRLFRIGKDSVEMMYLDGRGRQLIRLSGS